MLGAGTLLTGDATARRCEGSTGDTVAGATRLKAEKAPQAGRVHGKRAAGFPAKVRAEDILDFSKMYYDRHLAHSGNADISHTAKKPTPRT